MQENVERRRASARTAIVEPQQTENASPVQDVADGVGAWMWDQTAGTIEIDAACAALHNVAQADAAAPMSLSGWLHAAVPEDRTRIETAMREAARNRSSFRCEYDVVNPHGNLRRLLARGDFRDQPPRLLGATLLIARGQANTALPETRARFETIADSVDQMIWSTRPDGFHDYYNRRWYEFTGVPLGSTDGEAWNGMFHPDDQGRAWTKWRHSLATGEPYQIEYRLRHRSGEYRWVIGRAQCVRDPQGRILRWYGTCTDIDDLKQAQTERELIAQELSHRIKNIFTVVSSLVSLSARSAPEARPFATSVQARISALAIAHEYVRPHSGASSPPGAHQTLHGLLATLTAAYRTEVLTRITIGGDDVAVGQHAATSIALIIHELCTNAVKYGALSRDGGTVSLLTAQIDDAYRMEWEEQGGPRLQGDPVHRGFGTTLSERVVAAQLKASVAHDWRLEGLVFRITIPLARLSQ